MVRRYGYQEDISILKILEPIQTSSLIEQRIKMLMEDSNVDRIAFENGSLTYNDLNYDSYELPNWKLSLVDTLEFLWAVSELKEIETNDYLVNFKDCSLLFIIKEDTSISDLNERLMKSELTFILSKHLQDLPF